MRNRPKLIDAIVARFREGGAPIPADTADWRVQRTYAGSEQRAAGAWAWHLASPTNPDALDFGGYAPAKACARKGGTDRVSRETSLWSLSDPEGN